MPGRGESRTGKGIFDGVVEERVFARGSKSERPCLHLVLGDGTAVRLRRRGAHPYQDEIIENLRGKAIHATGTVRNGVLFLKDWEEAGDEE